MNKIYLLIWNSAQRARVIAGKFSRGKNKEKISLHRLVTSAAGVAGTVAIAMISMEDASASVARDSTIAMDQNIIEKGNVTQDRSFVQAVVADTDAAKGERPEDTVNASEIHNYSLNGDAGARAISATAQNSLAVGVDASATAVDALAVGVRSTASGEKSVAIGQDALASGMAAVALGSDSQASADHSTALGSNSHAKGFSSLAIGQGSKALDDYAMALGVSSRADGSSVAVGQGANAQTLDGQGWATAVGNSALANQVGAAAMGANAKATGDRATAIGADSSASAEYSMALGQGAIARNAQDVALGSGSVTDVTVGTSGTRIADKDYLFAGINPLSTISVGAVGRERTLTNVAAGRLIATSTDAVNGSQLFATNSAISAMDKVAVKYDINDDGTVNYNSVTLNGDTYNSTTKTGGTRIKNVAAAVDSGDAVNLDQLETFTAEKTKYFHAKSVKADSVASGVDSIAIGPNAQSKGNSSIAFGDEARSAGTNSMAIGQNAQSMGNSSVAAGAGAIATNANDVALGAGSVTQETVATTGTTISGNDYSFAGTNPTSTVSIGSEGNERTLTNMAAGRVSESSTDGINGSQLYATNQAIESLKASTAAEAKGVVKYEINKNGSVNYNKVIMGGDTYNPTTNTGGTTITNVANGVNQSDAVNKFQLDQVDNRVTNIANGTDGMFQVNNSSKLPKPNPTGNDAVAGGAGAIASGDNSMATGTNAKATHSNAIALGNNSVTDRANSLSVGSAGKERQITNVAAGTKGTDAVNLSQLKQSTGDSKKYTDNKFNNLKNLVDNNKDKLSAGIAGAMAMAGIPQPYQPGASMVGIAGGTYQGESALALGVSTISDNGKWVTKLSGTTNSQGDLGAAVGVGYQW